MQGRDRPAAIRTVQGKALCLLTSLCSSVVFLASSPTVRPRKVPFLPRGILGLGIGVYCYARTSVQLNQTHTAILSGSCLCSHLLLPVSDFTSLGYMYDLCVCCVPLISLMPAPPSSARRRLLCSLSPSLLRQKALKISFFLSSPLTLIDSIFLY